MLWLMQPDTGGRFDLRLRAHDPAVAGYDLTLSTLGGEWSTEATVSIANGSVECGAWRGDGEPPPWLLQYARSALRVAWQAHREQGWPRRLTRWRDVPARADAAHGDPAREGRDD
jgi:hypothetical protein